ncbi:MAG TPA: glycosyltransferase [Acidimicrobiales bacterium]|nr:glycosyltransferase [Acidimicrobiales bacterium]
MRLVVPRTSALRHVKPAAPACTPRAGNQQDRLDVEIVIPVFNEAPHLKERITTLRNFLNESFPFQTLVTIVDNGSTDGTGIVAAGLAETMEGVAALSLPRKGRGYALRTAWSRSTAHVVAYMDVDLSTSLTGFLPLVAPLLSGHSDVAVGTRLAPGARVVRGPKRELISRAYNLLLKLSLHSHISDAQCGFKALTRESALRLLPHVENDEWFFDTELVVTAERLGLRTSEVPVDWVDDPDSRVRILSTAMEDLRGIWRISHRRSRHQVRQQRNGSPSGFQHVTADQLLSFGGVGILSTLSYLLLFALGRPLVGTFGSNAVALAFCTLVNTSVHRTLSRGPHRGARQASPRLRFLAFAGGLFTISFVLTTLALSVADAAAGPSLGFELLAVTVANAVAALLRFSVLRARIFRPVGPDDSHSLRSLG